jgi:hypothetical protein
MKDPRVHGLSNKDSDQASAGGLSGLGDAQALEE